LFMDTALRDCAVLRCWPGGADHLGMGLRPVPSAGRAKPDNLQLVSAIDFAAPARRYARDWNGGAVAVNGLLDVHLQAPLSAPRLHDTGRPSVAPQSRGGNVCCGAWSRSVTCVD
jgi:hypothetical protein